MTLRLGAAFWVKAAVAVPRHLWVVVSEPNADGEVVVVNCTTRRPRADASCVIQGGEHPDITHETVIAYQHGEWMNEARYRHLLNVRALQLRQPFSSQLVRRVQEGALLSPFARRSHQDAIRLTMEHQG